MKSIFILKDKGHAILICSRLLHSGPTGFNFVMTVQPDVIRFLVPGVSNQALQLLKILDGIQVTFLHDNSDKN